MGDASKAAMSADALAGASLDTYQRAYMRAVPMRVLRAAEQHPRHADLSADEVLFL